MRSPHSLVSNSRASTSSSSQAAAVAASTSARTRSACRTYQASCEGCQRCVLSAVSLCSATSRAWRMAWVRAE
eukprot:7350988-Pyramimonas_sp.AAC.1